MSLLIRWGLFFCRILMYDGRKCKGDVLWNI
nr:MAG TPA: hypothetical protein [Caudoviricetes sp.]